MKLSIIILNYNVRYFLELCLKSVQAAVETIDAEIIVVDNNSEDDSCEMVKQLFPTVTLIENTSNSGFSKGNNIGVTKAKGEYICILNPDTVVAEDTFLKLIDFAESKESLGVVGCQLIDGKGRFLPESKRNIPTPKVSLKKMMGNPGDYYANHINKDTTAKVEILVGAFMLLKRNVYNAIGGFDEDYFMYGEDIDLSYKILKAGYSNYYFGETTSIHFKGESTLRDADYAKRFYGAMQIFYKKHFKQNLIFNAFVWLGIKFAYSIRKTSSIEKPTTDATRIFSKEIDESLIVKLKEPIQILEKLNDDIIENTLVIYDLNHLEIKAVIADIMRKSLQTNIVFRLLPKNSKFIIGSDSAVSRGNVIHFN